MELAEFFLVHPSNFIFDILHEKYFQVYKIRTQKLDVLNGNAFSKKKKKKECNLHLYLLKLN